MNKTNLDNLHHLKVFNNHLDSEFCKHLIYKFESDKRVKPGSTGYGYDKEMKDSLDLHIHYKTMPDWRNEVNYLHKQLHASLKEYLELHYFPYAKGLYNPYDSGFQIQKSSEGQKHSYDWHSDECYDILNDKEIGYRIVTFLWYLNTVEAGGETVFYDGTKITPESGKLILFPSTWDYNHKGCSPILGDKYICTGWFYNCYKDTKT